MSENLPAVPQPERPREVARTDTDSWIEMMRPVIALAGEIAGTEFVPKGLRNSPAAVTAAILYGRETGLPPMTALTQTHVIDGKPAMSAEAMRGLVLGAGHELHVIETTGVLCRMKGRRRGTSEWTEITWTLEMARAAGVANKAVWKQYPRQMLQARATTELVRLVFPDVIHGFRSLEEFNELDGVAVVEDEDGNTAPASTTKVTRKRAAKKTAAARPAPAAEAPAGSGVVDGPPLPGEPGFEDPAVSSAPVAEPVGGEAGGEAAEPSTGDQDDQEPVDAVLVEDEPPLPVEDPPGEDPVVEERPAPGPSSRAQHRMLFAALDHLGVTEENRHSVVSTLLDREVSSFNGLTKDEAGTLITTLSMFDGDRAKLDALLAEASR